MGIRRVILDERDENEEGEEAQISNNVALYTIVFLVSFFSTLCLLFMFAQEWAMGLFS